MTQEFAQAPVVGCKKVSANDNAGSHAKVYFTKHIDAEHLIKLYDLINESIYGKVAIKLHTGEKHGPNILPRELVKALQQQIPDSTIVETNTLYQGDRYTTEEHLDTLKVNGWTFCPVDIMDAEATVNLPVRHGKHFKEVSMGKNIVNYDSMLVLTHFKETMCLPKKSIVALADSAMFSMSSSLPGHTFQSVGRLSLSTP